VIVVRATPPASKEADAVPSTGADGPDVPSTGAMVNSTGPGSVAGMAPGVQLSAETVISVIWLWARSEGPVLLRPASHSATVVSSPYFSGSVVTVPETTDLPSRVPVYQSSTGDPLPSTSVVTTIGEVGPAEPTVTGTSRVVAPALANTLRFEMPDRTRLRSTVTSAE
jgi:hypothetical protein